jgi:hypothetical protein
MMYVGSIDTKEDYVDNVCTYNSRIYNNVLYTHKKDLIMSVGSVCWLMSGRNEDDVDDVCWRLINLVECHTRYDSQSAGLNNKLTISGD